MKHQIARRRTFAIISHPDAGKTTLTEKLLLYGGVIQLAGAVKAKRGRASAVSDWMEMERERGISITTSVLQFPYRGLQMNLLDTPGHADFSEDTYRTLHAVDGAVMLLDSAKGVEAQTRKLFRVCRQRAIPIFTFVNKLDRPGPRRLRPHRRGGERARHRRLPGHLAHLPRRHLPRRLPPAAPARVPVRRRTAPTPAPPPAPSARRWR